MQGCRSYEKGWFSEDKFRKQGFPSKSEEWEISLVYTEYMGGEVRVGVAREESRSPTSKKEALVWTYIVARRVEVACQPPPEPCYGTAR